MNTVPTLLILVLAGGVSFFLIALIVIFKLKSENSSLRQGQKTFQPTNREQKLEEEVQVLRDRVNQLTLEQDSVNQLIKGMGDSVNKKGNDKGTT